MEPNLLKTISEITDEEKRILAGIPLQKSIYSSGVEFIVNSDKLLEEGSDIAVRTHTRFASFPLHSHNYLEVMIVLSGKITHRIFGEELALSEGDILVMNKHIPHSIDKAEMEDVGVNIIISDNFAKELSTALSKTVFRDLAEQNLAELGDGMYLAFRTGGDKQIKNIVENLLFELTEYKKNTEVLKFTASLLFGYLSRSADKMLSAASKLPDKETKRKSAILSYIAAHYEDASLTELARILGLTVPYLSKAVQTYFAKSFKDLLFDHRIGLAKDLIINTNLSIGEIIARIGYDNESYFHREFKKQTGTTPMAMRRKLKNSISN